MPRFHFTGGGAVNAVVPMIREALQRERIEFVWNTEVTELVRRDGQISGRAYARRHAAVKSANTSAPAVVITTGGYQNNLDMVRRTWLAHAAAPRRGC